MLADILGYNPKAPTMIGKLSIDIMRQYEYQLDQEVTAHPVETGFEIHDTAINHPVKVTMCRYIQPPCNMVLCKWHRAKQIC